MYWRKGPFSAFLRRAEGSYSSEVSYSGFILELVPEKKKPFPPSG
jgi:hypothetical protein